MFPFRIINKSLIKVPSLSEFCLLSKLSVDGLMCKHVCLYTVIYKL